MDRLQSVWIPLWIVWPFPTFKNMINIHECIFILQITWVSGSDFCSFRRNIFSNELNAGCHALLTVVWMLFLKDFEKGIFYNFTMHIHFNVCFSIRVRWGGMGGLLIFELQKKSKLFLKKNKNTHVIYNSLTLFWLKKKLSGNSQFCCSLLESYIVKIKTNWYLWNFAFRILF